MWLQRQYVRCFHLVGFSEHWFFCSIEWTFFEWSGVKALNYMISILDIWSLAVVPTLGVDHRLSVRTKVNWFGSKEIWYSSLFYENISFNTFAICVTKSCTHILLSMWRHLLTTSDDFSLLSRPTRSQEACFLLVALNLNSNTAKPRTIVQIVNYQDIGIRSKFSCFTNIILYCVALVVLY